MCAGVVLRTVRLGTDRFLSSLGVEDRSWRMEEAEGERDIEEPLGVEDLARGVLKGDLAGEVPECWPFVSVSGTVAVTFRNLSLCGVLLLGETSFVCSLISTEGRGISGSCSILLLLQLGLCLYRSICCRKSVPAFCNHMASKTINVISGHTRLALRFHKFASRIQVWDRATVVVSASFMLIRTARNANKATFLIETDAQGKTFLL